MVFYDLFSEAARVVYTVISVLNTVHINVGTSSNYTQISLLDILEIAFGVNVLVMFSRFVFTRKEKPLV